MESRFKSLSIHIQHVLGLVNILFATFFLL